MINDVNMAMADMQMYSLENNPSHDCPFHHFQATKEDSHAAVAGKIETNIIIIVLSGVYGLIVTVEYTEYIRYSATVIYDAINAVHLNTNDGVFPEIMVQRCYVKRTDRIPAY